MMKNSLFCILTIAFISMSCTSYYPAQLAPTRSQVLSTLEPKSTVRIVLKDRQKIERMKIVSIDTAIIKGNAWIPTLSNGAWTQKKIDRTVVIKDMEEIQILVDERGRKVYQIDPGSIISVTFRDGQQMKRVKVIDVQASEIVVSKKGVSERIAFTDIKEMKKRADDHFKTFGLFLELGILVGLYLFIKSFLPSFG